MSIRVAGQLLHLKPCATRTSYAKPEKDTYTTEETKAENTESVGA